MSLGNIDETKVKLGVIMKEVKERMDFQQLKLNEYKTKCLIIGRNRNLQRLGNITNLVVNNSTIDVSNTVKDLGVLIDCNLSMNEQINKITRETGYHLRNIAFLKKYLEDTIKMLILNNVTNRLDYCNSLYLGLPKYQLRKMQSIMNRAARLIKGLPRRERITPALIELHWLPIKARIEYKICVLSFQALKFGKPKYIRDMLKDFQPGTISVLRHSDHQFRLDEPRCNMEIGFRAFQISVPRLINKLPNDIKSSPSIQVFKRKLKTYLFKNAYDLDTLNINEHYKV